MEQQQLVCVAASNLLVQSYDAARGLWVADAHTHASVQVVPSSDMRVRQTSVWARQHPDVIAACRSKVLRVIEGA